MTAQKSLLKGKSKIGEMSKIAAQMILIEMTKYSMETKHNQMKTTIKSLPTQICSNRTLTSHLKRKQRRSIKMSADHSKSNLLITKLTRIGSMSPTASTILRAGLAFFLLPEDRKTNPLTKVKELNSSLPYLRRE